MFKVKKRNNSQWRRSDVFIVIFEHILHLASVFLLLTLSRQMAAGYFFRFRKLAVCLRSLFGLKEICNYSVIYQLKFYVNVTQGSSLIFSSNIERI